MPLPLIGASLGGVIITSLTAWAVSKIPSILASLGVAAVAYKVNGIVADYVISGVQSAVASAGSASFMGHSVDLVGLVGACGVFEAANVVLSGYVGVAAIKASRIVWVRMTA